MSKLPYMKFYVDDWTGGTRAMTLAQKGAYIELLACAWGSEDGTLPAEDWRLALIVGTDRGTWRRIKSGVMAKFKRLPDGRYYNERLMKERAKAQPEVTPLPTHPVGNQVAYASGRLGWQEKSMKTKNAVQHPRASARATPESRYPPLPPLPGPAPSPARPTGAQAPEQKPVTERKALSPELLAALKPQSFPAHRKPINGAVLSPEDLAKAEAEAAAWIEGQQRP